MQGTVLRFYALRWSSWSTPVELTFFVDMGCLEVSEEDGVKDFWVNFDPWYLWVGGDFMYDGDGYFIFDADHCTRESPGRNPARTVPRANANGSAMQCTPFAARKGPCSPGRYFAANWTSLPPRVELPCLRRGPVRRARPIDPALPNCVEPGGQDRWLRSRLKSSTCTVLPCMQTAEAVGERRNEAPKMRCVGTHCAV